MKNLQDTVASVQNAPSSIFTKEDVLNLLNGIEFPKQVSINPLTQFQIESLCEKITEVVKDNAENLDNDCIDRDTAELSMGYNNTVELDSVEFDTREVADQVVRGIAEVIEEWFEKAFPENEDDEENESGEDNN
jgi:hypothetical protein